VAVIVLAQIVDVLFVISARHEKVDEKPTPIPNSAFEPTIFKSSAQEAAR
jgi:hypothetical protein